MVKERRGRAVVIGGGLSGLAAGYRLLDHGWDVLVLEKERETGGRCRSVEKDGFRFDMGAQYFRDSYDTFLKTAIRLGLGDRFRFPPKEKGIFTGRNTVTFTSRSRNPLSLMPAASLGPGAIADWARIAAPMIRGYRGFNIKFPELWVSGDEVSASDYLRRKTGPAFRSVVARPLTQFALGSDLQSISASGFMVALRTSLGDRTGTFSGGIGMLAEKLAEGLNVICGMEALELRREGRKVTGVSARPVDGGRARSYGADLVVCALPAPAARAVTGRLGRVAERVIKSVRYVPQVVVNMSFRGGLECRADPILIAADHGSRAGWLCTQESKAMEYAPAGSTLVTLVYSCEEAENAMGMAERSVLEWALEDAGRVLDIGGVSLVEYGVSRHPAARPLVSPGYAGRVRELMEAGSGTRNLVLAGDWTCSPTLEGAVASGFRAADRAASL